MKNARHSRHGDRSKNFIVQKEKNWSHGSARCHAAVILFQPSENGDVDINDESF